jgi:hypothetical protein
MFDPTQKDENDLPLFPQLLPYGHTIGAPAFRPNDQRAIAKRSISAMNEQVDTQMKMLREQAEVIQRQALELEKRRILSYIIYERGELKSDPCINKPYHLYKRDDGSFFLTFISPNEWNYSKKNLIYVATVKMLSDNTWALESSMTNDLQDLYDLYQ